jgi:hypothetical protein
MRLMIDLIFHLVFGKTVYSRRFIIPNRAIVSRISALFSVQMMTFVTWKVP